MPTETSAEERRRARLEGAFVEEERRSQTALSRVWLAGLALITVLVTWENGFPAVLFYYPFVFGLALIVIAPVLLWPHGRAPRWERYVRFAGVVILYTVLALSRNPLINDGRTPAMLLRWQNELYFFIFIAAATFTYSPRVVLCTGVTAALAWTAAALWIIHLPESKVPVRPELLAEMTLEQRRLMVMDPHLVFVNGVIRTALVLVVVSATLAVFVRRSRRLVLRHAEAERERGNLSRYFSANMVDELAQSDLPLSSTRRLDAAVLFVDIVGFTATSAREEPEAVIETLRQFHHRVERAVFAHDGTLEKYIGDGAMATFGTPRPGTADATNALGCVRTLLDSLEEWNDARRRRDQGPIRVGVGLHFGPVVLGDIGGEQRLEFAVVGDTVNLASRLERLTRELGAMVLASGDLVDAVRREGGDIADILPGLHQAESRQVRGREGTVRLWAWGTDSTPRTVIP